MAIPRMAEEARLSGAVVAGGLVFLAGQVADDATLDAEGQTADMGSPHMRREALVPRSPRKESSPRSRAAAADGSIVCFHAPAD